MAPVSVCHQESIIDSDHCQKYVDTKAMLTDLSAHQHCRANVRKTESFTYFITGLHEHANSGGSRVPTKV